MHIFLRIAGLIAVVLGVVIVFQAGGDAVRLLVGTIAIIGGIVFLALAQILIELVEIKQSGSRKVVGPRVV